MSDLHDNQYGAKFKFLNYNGANQHAAQAGDPQVGTETEPP